MSLFAPRMSVGQAGFGAGFGAGFAPRFDAAGLLPVAVMDGAARDGLMLGYRNAQALERTVLTGGACAGLPDPAQV